jgi:hypothetical protein
MMSLMNEELEKYDLRFIQASNDRAGGAQLVYTMLQTGNLVIADTCQNVIRHLSRASTTKKNPPALNRLMLDACRLQHLALTRECPRGNLNLAKQSCEQHSLKRMPIAKVAMISQDSGDAGH